MKLDAKVSFKPFYCLQRCPPTTSRGTVKSVSTKANALPLEDLFRMKLLAPFFCQRFQQRSCCCCDECTTCFSTFSVLRRRRNAETAE